MAIRYSSMGIAAVSRHPVRRASPDERPRHAATAPLFGDGDRGRRRRSRQGLVAGRLTSQRARQPRRERTVGHQRTKRRRVTGVERDEHPSDRGLKVAVPAVDDTAADQNQILAPHVGPIEIDQLGLSLAARASGPRRAPRNGWTPRHPSRRIRAPAGRPGTAPPRSIAAPHRRDRRGATARSRAPAHRIPTRPRARSPRTAARRRARPPTDGAPGCRRA